MHPPVPAPPLGFGIGEARVVAEDTSGLGHGYRVVGPEGGAHPPQAFDQDPAGRLAHVVGIGLERQAPQGEVPALRSAPKRFTIFVQHAASALRWPPPPRRAPEQIHAGLVRGTDQRLHVLGKAGAAVAAAGIEEVVADARIGADAVAHLLDVGAQSLGQVGQFVHERDARGQHGSWRRTW